MEIEKQIGGLVILIAFVAAFFWTIGTVEKHIRGFFERRRFAKLDALIGQPKNNQNKNSSPTGFTGRENPNGEVLPAAKLQLKYTLPSGERLKKMTLIGLAYAEAWANPHKRDGVRRQII